MDTVEGDAEKPVHGNDACRYHDGCHKRGEQGRSPFIDIRRPEVERSYCDLERQPDDKQEKSGPEHGGKPLLYMLCNIRVDDVQIKRAA